MNHEKLQQTFLEKDAKKSQYWLLAPAYVHAICTIAFRNLCEMRIKYFHFPKGAFKYYVIKEVGGWGRKMEIFDDLQYYKSSKRWVGLKKSKT